MLFQLLVDHRTTVLGYLYMLSAAAFIGGAALGAKEAKRPSRWNEAPPWLAEATARGEAGTDLHV